MVNCIAATLTMKCGIGAGYLFHYLTKLTKDDCQSETISSCQDSEFACKGNDSKAKEFDEIYDQLFKRMGHIPDQDDSSLRLQEEDSSTEESLDFEGETIADSEDFQAETPLSDSDVENEIPVFLVNTVDDPDQENVIAVDYDSMSELITSALNELDENSETDSTESTDLIYKMNEKNRENPEIAIEYSDTDSAVISSTVPSELKEYYEEITTMDTEDNYSKIRIFPDGRINYYRRNTAFTPIESVECRHFPEYFRCVSMHRQQNIQCLEQSDYTKPTSDEFFPEEIDPEFGAELHETLPKGRYIFKQRLDQSKDESDSQSCSSTSDSENTRSNYISDSQNVHRIKDMEHEADSETDECSRNVYSEINWTATESEDAMKLKESGLSHNMIQNSDVSEPTEENELENVSKLFSIFTAAWPKILGVKEIDLLPKDIADTMEDLFTYKTGLLRNARLDMDDFGNFYMYWANQQSLPIDTITCGRVNECHPKSEGVWKCVIVPREAEGKADGSTASTEQTY